MKLRLVACLFVWLALSAVAAFGQQNPLRGPEQQPPPPEPDQPVRPLTPILRPRAAPPSGEQPGGQYPPGPANQQRPPQPQPPFRLTPQEDAQVNRTLNLWEQRNAALKKFDCKFKRWVYNPVFGGDMAKPLFVEEGIIRFASPDKGLFEDRAQQERQDGADRGTGGPSIGCATAKRSSNIGRPKSRSRSIGCHRNCRAKQSPRPRCRSFSAPRPRT